MKKLDLKFGGIKEMLTKEQMKKITGGDDYGYGSAWTGQCIFYGNDGKPISGLTVTSSDNDGGHSSQCLADLACTTLINNSCSNVNCVGSAAC
jgi:hypothetical protein